MIIEKLQSLGLNKNEAATYLELCKLGHSSGGELIKATGFHRNIIYDNLEKLIEKGLVSYVIENNRKVFIASPPHSLQDFIEEEQKAINKKKTLANEIINKLKPILGKGNLQHEATIIRGVHALKQELENIFNNKLNYISFGAPERSIEIMSPEYWKTFSSKQLLHGVKGKLIFNESLRDWSKVIKTRNHNFRFLEKEFEPLTQTIVYGDTTLIIVWVDKPITTIIQSKEVAKSYNHFFNLLWKQAGR